MIEYWVKRYYTGVLVVRSKLPEFGNGDAKKFDISKVLLALVLGILSL